MSALRRYSNTLTADVNEKGVLDVDTVKGCTAGMNARPGTDKRGAYYCSEAETELWMRDNGLSVYNRIVYLESEFTRLAHAKRTLNTRKFPKREQKIIVAYKGDIPAIPDNFRALGRL